MAGRGRKPAGPGAGRRHAWRAVAACPAAAGRHGLGRGPARQAAGLGRTGGAAYLAVVESQRLRAGHRVSRNAALW